MNANGRMIPRLRGGLWGLVVGDALGLPYQFISRGDMEEEYPDPLDVPMLEGLWSDDSSLTLATAKALTSGYELGEIARNFLSWYREGEFTPRGYPFDIGDTTARAMERLERGVHPTKAGGRGEWDNGNGSLMRILPATYYAYFRSDSIEERLGMIHDVSSVTHAHPRSLVGCGIYSILVWKILDGLDKLDAYSAAIEEVLSVYSREPFKGELKHYVRVLDGGIHLRDRADISGSGYVVHTLEASVWAFLKAEDFASAVLNVVSLGEDTDTTGAVTGGLAGTYYGFESIPGEWLDMIEAKDVVETIVSPFVLSLLDG